MKGINKKSFLALGLMLGLGALSVAYAALSTTLTIQSGTESEPGVSVNPLVTFVKGETAEFLYDGGRTEYIKINYCDSYDPNSTEPGVVTISDNGLEANISGTTFSSTGTAVYILCLENKHNNTVYLAEDPTVGITNTNGDVSNIEVKLRYEDGPDPDVLKGTSLAAKEKKMLLLMISVNEMPKTPASSTTPSDSASSASLNFTFKPQWTTENPTTGSTGNQGEEVSKN